MKDAEGLGVILKTRGHDDPLYVLAAAIVQLRAQLAEVGETAKRAQAMAESAGKTADNARLYGPARIGGSWR